MLRRFISCICSPCFLCADKKDGKQCDEKSGKERTMLTPCDPKADGALHISWEFLNTDRLLLPPVSMAMVEKVLAECASSVSSEELGKMKQWMNEFGQEE